MMASDTKARLDDDFRQAMRCVASTVNIITICVDGHPMGITATAMSSLAMDPPSLLVCINRSASLHGSMTDVSHFGVNVLHQDQQQLARLFADSNLRELRFASGWHMDADAPPRLPQAQASILCRRTEHHVFGTHSIFIGVAEDVVIRDDIDPLVYLDGGFRSARD